MLVIGTTCQIIVYQAVGSVGSCWHGSPGVEGWAQQRERETADAPVGRQSRGTAWRRCLLDKSRTEGWQRVKYDKEQGGSMEGHRRGDLGGGVWASW